MAIPNVTSSGSASDLPPTESNWSQQLSANAYPQDVFDAIPVSFSPQEKAHAFLEEMAKRKAAGSGALTKAVSFLNFRDIQLNLRLELLRQVIEREPRATEDTIHILRSILSVDPSPALFNLDDRILPILKKLEFDSYYWIWKIMGTLVKYFGNFHAICDLHSILSSDQAGVQFIDVAQWDTEKTHAALLKVLGESFQHAGFEWVEPLLSSVKENPFVHRQIVVPIALILSWCTLKQIEPARMQQLNETDFFTRLFSLRAPLLYFPIALAGASLFFATERNDWQREVAFSDRYNFMILKILLLPFVSDREDFNNLSQLLCSGKSRVLFKNGPTLKFLLSLLLSLNREENLRPAQKRELLFLLGHAEDKMNMLRDLALLIDIERCGDLRRLIEKGSFAEELHAFTITAARELLPLEGENLEEKMSAIWASPHPSAIWRYAAHMRGEADAIKCFTVFINAVLQGTFPEIRYDRSKNLHLSVLDPAMIRLWRAEEELPQEGFKIIDTDNWTHLFLYGTLIPDSCLNIDLLPRKELLGTVMNGQTRILVVVDAEGKMMGRAILRLLLDEKSREPVLFLERYYGPVRYKKEVIQLALIKAEKMELPLTAFTRERHGRQKYPTSLMSHRAMAPADYSDGQKDTCTHSNQGEVCINESYWVSDSSFPLTGGTP